MKQVLFYILIILLTAAGLARGPDGYRFDKREATRGTVVVMITEHASREKLQNAYLREVGAVRSERDIQAFSVITKGSNVCRINIVKPEIEYAPEYVGHELYHCIYGEFHN